MRKKVKLEIDLDLGTLASLELAARQNDCSLEDLVVKLCNKFFGARGGAHQKCQTCHRPGQKRPFAYIGWCTPSEG